MSLVENDARVLAHVRIDESLSKQQTVGHVLDLGIRSSAVLESNGVTDVLSESTSDLLSDSFGDRRGGDSTRLSASDLSSIRESSFGEVLGHLSGLSGSSLSDNDEDGVLTKRKGRETSQFRRRDERRTERRKEGSRLEQPARARS